MTRAFSFLAEIGADAPLAEVKPMAAPAIRSLAATIRGAAADLSKLATETATAFQAEVEGFKGDVADTQAVLTDVKNARAELRAALGQGTNGGPALDDPTQAAPSAPQSAAPSTPFVTMEKTPIGFVPRRTDG